MRRLTFLTFIWALFAFIGCKQTAEDRYQHYLEQIADSSSIEFITPEKDPLENVDENEVDPFANDGGIVTIPDIPKEHNVNMVGNNYEVERMMMGKE